MKIYLRRAKLELRKTLGEILRAIDNGIERGEIARHMNNRKGVLKRTSFFTSVAAAMILA